MPVDIIDIHAGGIPISIDLSKQVIDGLSRPTGEKEIPTMLLYDEKGLRLYDDITTSATEYYLFAAEEEILKTHADEIVGSMHRNRSDDENPADEVVLELGSGSLRKTSHILLGLSRYVDDSKMASPITYYALDLEKRELERTLGEIEASDIGRRLDGKVLIKGMWGTYDDGIKFIENGGLVHGGRVALSSSRGGSPASSVPLHIIFLGSSIGNFPRKDAAPFLRSLPLRPGAGDTLLLGLDHDNDKEKIERAYNDCKGYTKRFKMNALKNAGRTLGDDSLFNEDKWEYINIYTYAERCHESYYRSKCSQTITVPSDKKEFSFFEDEMIKIEESVKYSEADAHALFSNGNLRPVQRWTDTKKQYSLWLLERPPLVVP
ncbi:hypothetical protein FA15DRAFT_417191 [Coprinopsis marcescibilis]|uniref:4-dimethylallyltryptophan N-methyltransferase n=1 Tax=Coprinopsis marcescibilis TaxID=230819 RepID=A0A5C3KUQ0_COPMA|nr:hypothetical protein FA15DRAFT_417191 [Coprinopsis marcescibilis]